MVQRQFKDVRLITCQGTVVALARTTTQTHCDSLWYNILDLDIDSSSDALDWSGFTELVFPTWLRPAGMALVDAELGMIPGLQTADAPFAAWADNEFIYLFRQSTTNTLWFNRFRLTRDKPNDQGEAPLILMPASEVRFRETGRYAYADSTRDPQSSLNADGEPYIEPTYDLSFVSGLEEGRFTVTATSSPSIGGRIWHIFTTIASSGTIKHYAIPSTDAAIFDLSGTTINSDYTISPTNTIELQDEAGNALSATAGPATVLYARRERHVTSSGESELNRELRVLLAQPVISDSKNAGTALLDFGVATQGTLARPKSKLKLPPLAQANYCLAFKSGTDVTLPNSNDSLNVTGGYKIDIWLRPTRNLPNRVQVVGDDKSDKTRGPYLDLVEGGRVAIGFGTGSATVEAITTDLVTPVNTWTHVVAEFVADGAGGTFSVLINDDAVNVAGASAASLPNGPITRIARQTDGYIGELDQLEISIDGDIAGTWPLDAVDYNADPPTTPDTYTGNANPGTVRGATLVAAATPLQTDSGGQIDVDSNGLTVEFGLADFLLTGQTPSLLSGSDGYLHLYQRGEDSVFEVAHFSTSTARASFLSDWKATATSEGGEKQTGIVSYVSRRTGTMMNAATTTVSAASSGDTGLCDVIFESTTGGAKETWTGVPRRADAFVAALNGNAVAQPTNSEIGAGGTIFFDYDGIFPQVRLPVGEAFWEAVLVLISLFPESCPLTKVDITENNGALDLILTYQPMLWDNSPSVPFSQKWVDVPPTSQKLLSVLSGVSETYDYTPTDSYGDAGDQSIWQLNPPGNGLDSPSLLFLGKAGVSDVSFKVSKATKADQANVTWGAKIGNADKSASFKDVPRDLASVVDVLNGTSSSYDYSNLSSGDRQTLNENLMLLASGPIATLSDMPTTSLLKADMLGGAAMLRIIQSGGEQRDLVVGAPVSKAATILQSAHLEGVGAQGSSSNPLRRGSTLFGISTSQASNGAVPIVQDTAHQTGGTANLSIQGTNGGWIRIAPPFALNISASTTTVTWDMSAPLAPALAPAGDFSVEGWLKQPLTQAPITSDIDRVITYQRTGTPEFPTRVFKWMVGTKPSATLKLTPTTRIYQGVTMAQGAGTMEWRIGVLGGYTGYIGSMNVIGASTVVFKVRLNSDNTIEVLDSGGTAVASWPTALAPGEWHYVSLAFTTDNGTMSLRLSVDGGAAVAGTISNLDSDIRLGQCFFGDTSQGQNAVYINEGSIWRRALTNEEMIESATRPLSNSSPDLGARYLFTEGSGLKIANVSSGGDTLNVSIQGESNPSWQAGKGLYRLPMAGVAERAMLASSSPLLGWSQFALTYSIGNALQTQDGWWAEAGTSSALSPGAELSLETWINPSANNANPQGLIARQGSYILRREANGTITFEVSTNLGSFQVSTSPDSSGIAPASTATYIAATAYTAVVNPTTDLQGEQKIQYQLILKVYLNGELAQTYEKSDFDDSITLSSSDNIFYMGRDGSGAQPFDGWIAQVRVWQTTMTAGLVANAYASRWAPDGQTGMVSFWSFEEMSGKTAQDQEKVANATLTSNEMWLYQNDTGRISLYVNGEASALSEISIKSMGGYGADDQFVVSNANLAASVPYAGFSGYIDDLRLWSVELTEEQISDSMFRLLTGAETNLEGYWKFDNGSGSVITDFTGRGNTGTVTGSLSGVWSAQGAPVSNEAPEVLNVLGGVENRLNRNISGSPTAVEYSDLQRDSSGNLFSVMKRAYMAPTSGFEPNGLLTVSGFKVGDLDTVHVGQVQTRPSLIGFIEGAPPIPSENQTSPYYLTVGTYFKYVGITKVALTQTSGVSYGFSASESQDYAFKVEPKLGPAFETVAGTSAGIGAEVQVEPVKIKSKITFSDAFSFKWGSSENAGLSIGSMDTFSDSLAPAGVWEAEGEVFNQTTGRRFITDSVGYALVKSLTADLYSSQLKGTDTTVKLTVVPSEDIPPDVNLIDFPLNPAYIQTGSLDGKIGLKELPENTPSFFRPVEAYALKREAERIEAEAQTYYDSFDVSTYRASRFASETGLERFKNDAVSDDPSYNWTSDVNKRSIVNTYVWTAGGGYHSEETQLANTYSENYAGLTETAGQIKLGFEFEAPGVHGGADATFDTSVTVTAEKSRARDRGFALSASVDADGWLNKPIVQNEAFAGYETNAAPGKVDSYRFMSMYLPPSHDAFNMFFAQVVDPVWLALSNSPNAAALRETSIAENGCWRVLYRTTFVSRIPPSFQSAPTTEDSPDINPPPRVAAVAWLTDIVEGELMAAGHDENPTPEQIGTALQLALGTGPSDAGVLGTLIPWWSDFLTASEDLQNEASLMNYVIRTDALNWMNSRWLSIEAEAGATLTMSKLVPQLSPAD
ncbi:LamG-like jellyroll fold domain-containing protein [Flexibacterium corallicola]|uniref:LamG-like jellyroll fold domain-containing protein n=1 Tax=Flexibacterium corallicola TaxID=3037259 RepID=UPI00286F44BD|nr:LamG-like jellyroll fold domain-containing protein [Pseudovibrio sp. M1P-2-3]